LISKPIAESKELMGMAKVAKMHFISKEAERWLTAKGKRMIDVDRKFEKKMKELRKKKLIIEKQPWSEKLGKLERKVGRSVYLKQSNFPFKMFVLQETFLRGEEEPEIRLGYYLISPRALIEKGKLRLVWGQYNPNIPKEDFKELIRRAEKEGIVSLETSNRKGVS
jgi:hypothetical protein